MEERKDQTTQYNKQVQKMTNFDCVTKKDMENITQNGQKFLIILIEY